jgi:hypothetical protein
MATENTASATATGDGGPLCVIDWNWSKARFIWNVANEHS